MRIISLNRSRWIVVAIAGSLVLSLLVGTPKAAMAQTASTPPSSPALPSPNEELIEAAFGGDVGRMQAALARGANINARMYQSQETPVMAVAQCANVEAVAFVLSHHPDLTVRDSYGNTVTHFALEPLSLSIQEAKQLGNEAARKLTDTRKLRIVEMLLAQGATVNDVDDFGYTPLQVLVDRRGGPFLVGLLARHGAKLNVTGKRGEAALHIAVQGLEWNYVRALLQVHADPNVRDHQGRTPLMLATYASPDEYKMLLDAGANVNARDNEGRTPLMALFEAASLSRTSPHTDNEGEFKPESISFPSDDCLALLFRKGAKVNARNNAGATALQMAQLLASECEEPKNRREVERIIGILRDAGAKR